MVKIIRAPLLIALIGIGGCNLGIGIFPDRLMSYEGYADLSGYIEKDRVWDFNFQIIRDSRPGSGNPEYLVLSERQPGFQRCPRRDLRREPQGAREVHPRQPRRHGSRRSLHRARSDGGRERKDRGRKPALHRLAARAPSYADSISQLWHQGLAVPEGPDMNIANIRCEGSDLWYRRYTSTWTFMAEGGPTNVSSVTGTWSKVAGIWHRGTDILLVLFHEVPPAHIVRVDPLALRLGRDHPHRSSTAPMTGRSRTRTTSTGRRSATPTEGFAVYRNDTNQYVRFDELGTPIGTPLNLSEEQRPYEQRHVYGRTAGWFILSPKEMTLERRAWWWK